MAKQIMQFRYYEDNGINNQPKDINRARLAKGSLFNNYLPITQLGIQALPGTKFYLNNSTTPVLIGSTGVFELNLEGLTEITNIHFDPLSLESIDKNPNAYLIIDIISDLQEV